MVTAKPVAPISSLKIVVGAVAVIPFRFRVFARALAVPFVLYTAFDSVWLLQPALEFYDRFRWPMFALTQLLDLALYTITAVTTHRIVLLGASSVPRYGIEWARHTTRFFAFALSFTSAGYATAFILSWGFRTSEPVALSFLPSMGLTLGTWVLAFFLARLLLVFPAAAVGQPITLLRSWELTRQRQVLMFLIVIVYPILIGLPTYVISDSSTAGYLLRSVIELPALVVTVILLSFAYQQIQKERLGAE